MRAILMTAAGVGMVLLVPPGAAAPQAVAVDRVLERLAAEERVRAAASTAAEADAEARRIRDQRALEEERARAAEAAAAAMRAFEIRRAAMRDWHASFAASLDPLLRARGRLYRRIPHRLFAAVRSQCEDVARAAETAASLHRPAPERNVEVLAGDLLEVYRESARCCAAGAYFSFIVQEQEVRRLVTDLIAAFEPYGLSFPIVGRKP